MRPPSRHKSPPKALELEIPDSIHLSSSKIKIKSFQRIRPNTSKSDKFDIGNHDGFDKTLSPYRRAENSMNSCNEFNELLCKTDEDELQLDKNQFLSPIPQIGDREKSQKYSVTM